MTKQMTVVVIGALRVKFIIRSCNITKESSIRAQFQLSTVFEKMCGRRLQSRDFNISSAWLS